LATYTLRPVVDSSEYALKGRNEKIKYLVSERSCIGTNYRDFLCNE
jgi:hypothetical protein